MARTKYHSGVRFEIWPQATELTYIQNHLTNPGQSVKGWIESQITKAVKTRKKRQTILPLYNTSKQKKTNLTKVATSPK
jgi:hypothetical protein